MSLLSAVQNYSLDKSRNILSSIARLVSTFRERSAKRLALAAESFKDALETRQYEEELSASLTMPAPEPTRTQPRALFISGIQVLQLSEGKTYLGLTPTGQLEVRAHSPGEVPQHVISVDIRNGVLRVSYKEAGLSNAEKVTNDTLCVGTHTFIVKVLPTLGGVS